MKVVDFRTSLYFSGAIIFMGVLFVVAGFFLFTIRNFGGAIPLLISVAIFTTHYRIRIDFESKEYFDYLWILGFKNQF